MLNQRTPSGNASGGSTLTVDLSSYPASLDPGLQYGRPEEGQLQARLLSNLAAAYAQPCPHEQSRIAPASLPAVASGTAEQAVPSLQGHG